MMSDTQVHKHVLYPTGHRSFTAGKKYTRHVTQQAFDNYYAVWTCY